MAVTNNAAPSRLGQINKAGDADALFLKKYSGEVLTTFLERRIITDQHQIVRTITNGKSAQFPVFGTTSAKYHTPGKSLIEGDNAYLQQIGKNEKVITIDDLLVCPHFIANIDEAKAHYDYRAPYTEQSGEALANHYDQRALQVLVLAARAAATITGGNSGTVLSKGATVATSGTVLAAAIFEAAQKMDEKNIPSEGRYCVVRPAQYYLLAQTTGVINKDWGGSGSYAEGTVMKIAGISILKSNHLPSTNISAVTGENNTYSGDFSDTTAVVFHKTTMGTVKLMDISSESEYQIERQGTLMVSKVALGMGILRPESSVEISKA